MDIETQFDTLQTAATHRGTWFAPNLGQLAAEIRADVPAMPRSYVVGKTMLRDAVVHRLGCSIMRAERIVDEMERAGQISFRRNVRGPLVDNRWMFRVR